MIHKMNLKDLATYAQTLPAIYRVTGHPWEIELGMMLSISGTSPIDSPSTIAYLLAIVRAEWPTACVICTANNECTGGEMGALAWCVVHRLEFGPSTRVDIDRITHDCPTEAHALVAAVAKIDWRDR